MRVRPSAPNPEPGSERREHTRKPVLWAAELRTPTASYNCIILNLSLGGARLQLAAPLLPLRVTQVLERFGTLEAEVVWQVNDAVGIRFLAPPDQVSHQLNGTLPL